MPAKIRFSVKKNAHFGGFVGLFLPFCESKKSFSALLQSFFRVAEGVFGYYSFFTQKVNFWFYFQLKRLIHDHEN